MNSTTLTSPGTLHTATIGGVTFSAQAAVGGGATIHVWCGPSRHNAVSYSYTDVRLASARLGTIAHLAATGLTATQITDQLGANPAHALAQVRALLDDAMRHASADPSREATQLVAALQAEKEAIEPEAETARLAALAANINAHLDAVHGACRADEQGDESEADTDDADLIAFAKTVGDTVAQGVRDTDRPATLAALAHAYRNTHTQFPTRAETRAQAARAKRTGVAR